MFHEHLRIKGPRGNLHFVNRPFGMDDFRGPNIVVIYIVWFETILSVVLSSSRVGLNDALAKKCQRNGELHLSLYRINNRWILCESSHILLVDWNQTRIKNVECIKRTTDVYYRSTFPKERIRWVYSSIPHPVDPWIPHICRILVCGVFQGFFSFLPFTGRYSNFLRTIEKLWNYTSQEIITLWEGQKRKFTHTHKHTQMTPLYGSTR